MRRATIEPGLPQSPLPEKPEQVGRALNMEIMPVLRALREVANFVTTEKRTAVTAGDGAYTRLWTSAELPTDGTLVVWASVVGTASAAGGAAHAGYLEAATFQSVASVCTQTGVTTVLAVHESTAGIDARMGIDSVARVAYLEVRDDAAAAMRFTAVVQATGAEL